MEELLSVDTELVKEQLPQVKEHLAKFGDKLPAEISAQLEALEQRLSNQLSSHRADRAGGAGEGCRASSAGVPLLRQDPRAY